MKIQKKVFVVLVALLLAVGVFAGCSQGGGTQGGQSQGGAVGAGVKVGFSQIDHLGPWRVVETNDIESTAKARGFDFVYTDAQDSTAKQLSDIEDLIAQKVDYLLIAPREATGLERGLKAAKDAGIPVILVDREHAGEPGVDFVTSLSVDFIFEGSKCGEALAEAMGGKGNIVVIEGQPGGSDGRDRRIGFDGALEAYPDIQIIASQPADYSRSKAQSVMENYIQSYGSDIGGVFCYDDEMAMGAIAAIEQAGMKPGEDIKIAGIDGQKVAIQAILDGKMTVVVTCSPLYGNLVFDTIEKLMRGEKVETFIQLEDYVINIDNAAEELEKGF